MDQDTAPIRRDLERTRAELTDVVDAIRYRVNVPGRAREAISRRRERLPGREELRRRVPSAGGVAARVPRPPAAVSERLPGGRPAAMSGLGMVALAVLGTTLAVLLRRRRETSGSRFERPRR